MTTIGETYIHLRPYNIDRVGIEALGQQAVMLAVAAFKETYGFDGTIEVNIERGSAKIWITLLTTLSISSIYDNVAKYHDFKASVADMVQDAKDFGTRLNPVVISVAEANLQEVYRTERRTKTPGKLLRGLDKIETAKTRSDVDAAIASLRSALQDLTEEDQEALERVVDSVYPYAARKLYVPQSTIPGLAWEGARTQRLTDDGKNTFSMVVDTSDYGDIMLPRIPDPLLKFATRSRSGDDEE